MGSDILVNNHCHSERSEDELLSQRRKISVTHTNTDVDVTEILPPYGRLNDIKKLFLLLPMERLEIGRSILPRRLTHGIDDERSYDHHDTTDYQDGIPHGITTYGNLSWRDKTEDERQQRAKESQTTNNPHQAISLATDAERTGHILQIVAQVDAGCKHHQIHDEVKQNGEL